MSQCELTQLVIDNLSEDQLKEAAKAVLTHDRFKAGGKYILSQVMEMCRLSKDVMVPEGAVEIAILRAAAHAWVKTD